MVDTSIYRFWFSAPEYDYFGVDDYVGTIGGARDVACGYAAEYHCVVYINLGDDIIDVVECPYDWDIDED